MKKLLLVACLFINSISYAQITLLHTADDDVSLFSFADQMIGKLRLDQGYVITSDDVYPVKEYSSSWELNKITLYDALTWQPIQVFNAPANCQIGLVAKNIFTNDGVG